MPATNQCYLPTPEAAERHGSICAVVLAAGMSRRMGQLKMLLPFGDRPMLGRVIEGLQSTGRIGPVIVVTGYSEKEIRAVAVEYNSVVCVHNLCYDAGGMLSSVKTGIKALPEMCEAFFLVLGDQPLVRAATLSRLRTAWHPDHAPIVVPAYEGKRGHPLLISTRFADEIQALGETETLKALILRHGYQLREIAVDDEGTVRDIDTPEEYEAALARWRETEPGT